MQVQESKEYKSSVVPEKDTDDQKADFLRRVITRVGQMQTEREPFEKEWDYIDAQVNSKSFYDNDGRLIANCSVEQTLLEIHTGRTNQKLNFDVTSVGVQADNVEEKTSKFALMDTLERDNFWKEYQKWEYNRGKYGTAVFVTFPKMDKILQYAYKKDTVSDDMVGEGYFSKKMIKSYMEKWQFSPRERSIRQLFIDDRAVWQSDIDKVVDICLVETITKGELEQRYSDKKVFDIEGLEEMNTDDTAYGVTTTKGFVVLRYYYDKITKEYGIIGNKNKVIYKCYMTTDELPISIASYRYRSDCIYGYGLPRIVRTSKRYKDMIEQAIMDGSILASRVALITNNTNFVDGDPQMSGLVNLWRTTGTGEAPQQVNMGNNLGYLTSVLSVIEDNIRADTGMDIRSPFEAPAQQLGTVEIMEENKAIRYKSVDWSRDLAIDRAFTQCLNNIVKFMPIVQREVEVIDGVKTTKARPKIKVPNHKVETKDDGKMYFTESYGDYGFFELKPRTRTGDLIVSIVTPSTYNNNSVALSKNKNKELVNTITGFANIYGQEAVAQEIPFKDMWRLTKMDYGIGDQMTPDSDLDIKKRDQIEALESLKNIAGLSLNTPDENTNRGKVSQTMGAEQGVNGTQTGVGQNEVTVGEPAMATS